MSEPTDLTTIIAAHWLRNSITDDMEHDDNDWSTFCQCGHRIADTTATDIESLHRAHVAAAIREALAPIRALHIRGTEAGYEDEPYCETCGHYDGLSADFTHQPWPCDTARLIYTTEELSDE